MKYTEFEEKVKEIDASLVVEHAGTLLLVWNGSGAGLLRIGKKVTYSIDTLYATWGITSELTRVKLYNLATELAETPLEERREPKKYYYRLPYNVHHGNYLNFDTDEGVYHSTKKQLPGIQTQFTREEYTTIAKEEGIPDGYHIPVEVTDDE